eukprot:768752-Hanusia_phi.AAC.1
MLNRCIRRVARRSRDCKPPYPCKFDHGQKGTLFSRRHLQISAGQHPTPVSKICSQRDRDAHVRYPCLSSRRGSDEPEH